MKDTLESLRRRFVSAVEQATKREERQRCFSAIVKITDELCLQYGEPEETADEMLRLVDEIRKTEFAKELASYLEDLTDRIESLPTMTSEDVMPPLLEEELADFKLGVLHDTQIRFEQGRLLLSAVEDDLSKEEIKRQICELNKRDMSDWEDFCGDFRDIIRTVERREQRMLRNTAPVAPPVSIPVDLLQERSPDEDVSSSGATPSGEPPKESSQSERPGYDDPRDLARDRWIYERRKAGRENYQIIEELGKIFAKHDWGPITTAEGVRLAVKNYCLRTGAEPLPRSKGGRPRKKTPKA